MLLKVIVLMCGCAVAPGALAVPSGTADPYLQAKRMYDLSRYTSCIDLCDQALASMDEDGTDHRDYVRASSLYELRSQCLELSGKRLEAVHTIQAFLDQTRPHLSEENAASLQLKVGHMYKRAGKFTQALSAFRLVEQQYGALFPDRFARYAHEAASELLALKKAVVTGRVTLNGQCLSSGITVRLFNGYEESETRTDASGRFAVPLFVSTPGTRVCLTAFRPGYRPNTETLSFTGQSSLSVPPVCLDAFADNSHGLITGVVFTPTRGGKRRPHHGIARFVPDYDLSIMDAGGTAAVSTRSDSRGVFTTAVPPGTYSLHDGLQQRIITIAAGQVKVLNVQHLFVLKD